MTPSRPAVANRTFLPVAWENNPMQKLGFFLLLLFLYVAYSRVMDLTVPSLHLPLILSLMAFVATVLCGGIPRALSSRIGVLLIAFTGWMIVCVPFSTWKGGSFGMLRDEWLKSLLCFLMVAGLTTSLKQSRQIMLTLAFASLSVAAIAVTLGYQMGGRLALPKGLLANPNDLAQILLLGLPFCALPAIRKGGLFRWFLAFGAMLFLVLTIVSTGSRSALIAAAAMAFLLFLRAPAPAKIAMTVVAAFGLLLVALILPPQLRSRYLTTFGAPEPGQAITEHDFSAFVSRENRRMLLMQSLRLTIQNPVFGVGPGVFTVASSEDFGKQRVRALWRETHNSYTQISSECGIPGFLLYVGALAVCFRRLAAFQKIPPGDPRAAEVRSLAFCLTVSLVGFATTSFFSSIAYKFFFPTVFGLTAAFAQAAKEEVRSPAPSARPVPGLRTPLRAAFRRPAHNRTV